MKVTFTRRPLTNRVKTCDRREGERYVAALRAVVSCSSPRRHHNSTQHKLLAFVLFDDKHWGHTLVCEAVVFEPLQSGSARRGRISGSVWGFKLRHLTERHTWRCCIINPHPHPHPPTPEPQPGRSCSGPYRAGAHHLLLWCCAARLIDSLILVGPVRSSAALCVPTPNK